MSVIQHTDHKCPYCDRYLSYKVREDKKRECINCGYDYNEFDHKRDIMLGFHLIIIILIALIVGI